MGGLKGGKTSVKCVVKCEGVGGSGGDHRKVVIEHTTHTQVHNSTNLIVVAPPSSSSQVTACLGNPLPQWQL